jgi:hypothetical protein
MLLRTRSMENNHMQQNEDDFPDLPLNVPSTGTKGKSGGNPPAKGKTKGGPSKPKDIKATSMKKIAAPKSGGGGKSSGGLAGALKGASKPKIGVTKAKNEVRPRLRTQKAGSQFSLPKPAMSRPSTKKVGGRKR